MIRFVNGRVLRFAGEMRLTGGRGLDRRRAHRLCGPRAADAPVFERTVNLNGDVLMPGFKNAHTHTAMTFLRSYADDMPLNDWLYKQVFPHEAKVTPEMLYVFTRLGILEYLSSGITASFDMYFHNDAYAQANIDSGFRTVICAALNNFDKDVENIEREYLKFNALHELVSYRLGIHAEYTTCRERMEYSGLARPQVPRALLCPPVRDEGRGGRLRGALRPHAAAAAGLPGLFRLRRGRLPLRVDERRGRGALPEKAALGRHQPLLQPEACQRHLPGGQARAAGIPMAIGTDGAASNNALDFFREMYLASVLQKVKLSDAAAGGADRVLEMACVGGARVMGLEDCDDIAPGKRADLIVLDLNRPNMQPLHNIPRNIVYAGSKENVRLTMVNGRVLYENGEFFIGEDPRRLYAKANAMIREITA